MGMTIESINAVEDSQTPYLLAEPRFLVEGREADLLTERELKRKVISYTNGVDEMDILSEGTRLLLTVGALADIVGGDKEFTLVHVSDAKLIHAIVKRFLEVQAKTLKAMFNSIDDEANTDFRNLTKLANGILNYVRIEDMNTEEAMTQQAVEEVDPFDFLSQSFSLSSILTVDDQVVEINEREVRERYQFKPAVEIRETTSNMNRLQRWSNY